MGDTSRELVAAVTAAYEQGRPMYISAGGSKRHMVGRACDAALLDVSGHHGIIDYQPAELVLTARAGTPLAQVEQILAEQGQILPCESPLFGGRATLGGTLACNLSGPARPWSGSIRDLVLGVQLINGRGELLNFGGKVMKNVAGYDVSRLQAGALGTLGVMTRISIKVLPRPEHTVSLAYELPAQEAIEVMNRRAGESGPLCGASWVDGRLYLRLSGAAAAVEHTARSWGGEVLGAGDGPWEALREMVLPGLPESAPLWRFSINGTAPAGEEFGAQVIDWCGALRWVGGTQDHENLQQVAANAGGHVTLFRGGDRHGEVRPPLQALEQRLQRQLKKSFDPDGILNPGRLYPWL